MNENANLHFVTWKRVEPCFRWECYENPPIPYAQKKKTWPSEKATVRIGEAVYRRVDGQTAIIKEVTDTSVKVVFDKDNKKESIGLKQWIIKVPFYTAKNYVPIYREVRKSNLFLGMRLGNAVNPSWVDAVVRPLYDNACPDEVVKKENGYDVNEIESFVYDDSEGKAEKYEIRITVPKDIDSIEDWKKYYVNILELAERHGIWYLAVPFPLETYTMKQFRNIVKTAIDSSIEWSKKELVYQMRMIFICTCIEEYKEFSSIFDEYFAYD